MENNLHLLDLPVDIIELLLMPFLTTPLPIPMNPNSRSPVNPLPLFLVHPALYRIAAPIFYRRNLFVLDISGDDASNVRRHLMDGPDWPSAPDVNTLLTNEDALREIGRLELRTDRLRGWLGKGVVPKVQEMIVQGKLEHFTVLLSYATGTRPRPAAADSSLFTRPPLDGLLRLLADPYLRSAELWVQAGRHPPAWCRYHAGQWCGMMGEAAEAAEEEEPGQEQGQTRQKASQGRDGYVEIDWRKVLQVVDPTRRDVAVVWAEDPAVMRLR